MLLAALVLVAAVLWADPTAGQDDVVECSSCGECNGAANIRIPEGVTSIEAWAFYRCSSIESVEIPDGVTSIEGGDKSGNIYVTFPASAA